MAEPIAYAMLDVETTMIEHGQIPRTLFWGLADSVGYYRFTSTANLLTFLDSYAPHTLLHHSNFDILQLLVDSAPVYPTRTYNGKIIQCSLGMHRTLNTHAMFPVKLKTILEAFGYAKIDLDDLDKRNYSDCVEGLDAILKFDALFMDLVGVSPLARHTVASTSFAAAQLVAGKMPQDLRYIEAYRGGRVEVFDINATCATKWDINSSYPFSFVQCPESSELLTIEVETKDYYAPYFDSDYYDRLLFPNGRFNSYVYADNLERYLAESPSAIKIKARDKIDLSWLCRVSELVWKLYSLKQSTKDRATREVCKLLLNSMYGRIGMRGQAERCRVLSYIPMRDDITVCQLDFNKYLVFEKITIQNPQANYPLAAYITDNARARLYNQYWRCNPLYSDTDSMITRYQCPLYCGSELGSWKYEGEAHFQAHNVKDYEWDGDRTIKGGLGGVQWTLKQFARGETAKQVNRQHTGEINKRVVDSTGVTYPIEINL